MGTKVAIKSGNIPPFDSTFYAMNEFSRLGMPSLINCSLDLRCLRYGYQYSEILSSLFHIYYYGGDHVCGEHWPPSGASS